MQPVIIFADHLQTTLDNQSEIGEKVSVLLIEQFTEQSYDAIHVVQAFRQVQGGGQLLLVELVRNGRSHSPLILNLTANTATPAPDIEKPAAITLPEGGLDLFKAIFTDCSRVVIEEEFGGGFSGSYAYGVIPIHQKGGSERRKLRCVVKLASVEITVRETHGYADNMYIPDSPHLVREAVVLANGRFGGLCISRVGGPDLEEVSLGAYISAADSGVEDVAKVMKMTLDLIHSNGESSQPRQQYHLLGGYDKQMPVNLLLRPMPVPNDAQRVVIHANAPPAQAPEVGTYVRLEQFAIVKYDDKDHTVTLNCPDSNTNWMSSYRVRLVEVDPEAYTSIEKNPSVIEGIVVQTRMSQLYQEASRALGPSIDIYAPTYKLSNGLQMPNPIAKLPGLLDERIEIRYGYAHGDLNLENVRIRRSTGAPELIDYAEAGDDHIIRDYLHLETQIMSKIVAPLLHTHQLPVAETIADLYQRLHWAVFYGDQVDVRVWEPALEKPFAALKIVRQAAGEFLFKPYAYREYYLGLALHLIGAQRYGNLNRVPEAPVPKQVLFWGAAEAIALAEEMHEQKDEEKDEQRGRLNPYRGLKFFDVQHADDFFGRETVTLELLAKIRRMVSPDAGNESRFLAIIGPSGSGKSSLARAGVVAALRQGALAGSEQWSTIILRPKDEPLANLAQAVHSGEPPADFMQSLHTDPETLHRHIQQQSSQNAHPVTVLLIDQFEELFTLSQDEAARLAFLQNVLFAATVVNGRILILFTLRADFYGECAAYPRLAQLLSDQQMLIGPMGQEDLQAVIEKPALRSVAFFESGLVQTLLDDVLAQTGNLPLLQDALHELWQQQSRRLMTHADYEKIGRIKGAIQKRAEEFYHSLTLKEQRTCRHIFLRLIHPGEETAAIRRIATQEELGTAWQLVQKLVNERLLVTSRNENGVEQVEVAHESLIQTWLRLQNWLEESREELYVQQRLTENTREWLNANRDTGLLAGGIRLGQFEDLAQTTTLLQSEAEQAYLASSIAHREQLTHKEVERQKRELHLTTQSRNRLRGLVSVLMIGVIGMAILSFLLFGFRNDAVMEAASAENALSTAEVSEAEAQTQKEAAEESRAEAQASEAEAQTQKQTAEDARATAEASEAEAQTQKEAAENALATAQASEAEVIVQTEMVNIVREEAGREVELSKSRFLALHARDAFEQGNLSLAYRLALLALEIKGPPIEALQALYAIAYAPTVLERIITPQTGVGAVSDGVYSTDGKRVYVAMDLVYELDGHTGDILNQLDLGENILNLPTKLALDPTNRLLMVGYVDGTIVVWDTTEEEVRWRIPNAHMDQIWQVDIHPNGSQALTASFDGTVAIWDLADGVKISTLEGHSYPVVAAVYSPDGNLIASAARNLDIPNFGDIDITVLEGELIVWDTNNFSKVQTFDYFNPAGQVAFSPDSSNLLAAFDPSGVITERNIETGLDIFHFEGHGGPVNAISLSQDGTRLISGASDNSVIIWNFSNGDILHRFNDHQTGFVGVAITSPDNSRLLSGDSSGIRNAQLLFYNLNSHIEVQEINEFAIAQLNPFDGEGHLLAYKLTQDGLAEVDAISGQTIRVYSDSKSLLSTEDEQNEVVRWRITPDSKHVLIHMLDSSLVVLDRVQSRILIRKTGGIALGGAYALHPNGTQVISQSPTEGLILWDVSTGKIIRRFEDTSLLEELAKFEELGLVDRRAKEAIAFSSSTAFDAEIFTSSQGSFLLTGGVQIDGFDLGAALRLWDLDSGQVVQHFPETTGDVNRIAIDPEGRIMIAGQNDGMITVWDIESGAQRNVFSGHEGIVNAISISHDGTVAISGDTLGRVVVWDLTEGLPLYQRELNRLVTNTAISPDGTTFWVNAISEEHPEPFYSYLWRIESPTQVGNWLRTNTIHRDLTCTERNQYGLALDDLLIQEAQVGEQVGTVPPLGVQTWIYAGQAGEQVTISVQANDVVTSKDFLGLDTTLTLKNSNCIVLDRNDDVDNSTTNSGIVEFELPAESIYEIEVSSYLGLTHGDYMLVIESSP